LEVHVNHPYLLAKPASPLATQSLRLRPFQLRLCASDPAARAMNDFLDNPPRTIADDAGVDDVIDEMFRRGVRAFLVVRESSVVGLITAEDASAAQEARRQSRREARRSPVGGGAAGLEPRAADMMTPTHDVPAIDWQTLQDSRISDLLEIFEATGLRYLVVLQSETATWCTVRGLIDRRRLERQLRG
jgi:CBS domain-containing protein